MPVKTILKKTAKWTGLTLLALLGLALLVGLIPISSAGLASAPQPATGYEEALARFAAIEATEAAIAPEITRSRLLAHGQKTPRAYVLIHGATNSPRQFWELGDALFERSHNVLIMRMPYHGLNSHSVDELKRLTPQDLRAYADQAVDLAAGLGDEVRVIGLSGGGSVTAWIAQNRPDVSTALLVSPLFGVSGLPVFLDNLLMNLAARVPNINLVDPTETPRDHVYRGESTRGVAAFLGVAHRALAQARQTPAAVQNIIILTTASDTNVNNHYTETVAAQWQELGATLTEYEFPPELNIPHDSIDVSATGSTAIVYPKILDLLSE
jgi:esterase/lipase